jgi:large subunit ribosomal protein L24
MKIKKGDNVIVISGSDKGRTGKVVLSIPKENKILVEGVNMKKKHKRRTTESSKGQVVEKPRPIDVSNVKLADSVSKPKKAKKVKDNK